MDADDLLRVATDDPTPPYEQLRRQLLELIGSGRLEAGQRLPPVRQLAADLGLAAGTVARAYRALEAAGVVVTRRGGGTRVAAAAQPPSGVVDPAAVQAHAAALVRQGRRLGASDAQIRAAVDAALEDGAPGEAP